MILADEDLFPLSANQKSVTRPRYFAIFEGSRDGLLSRARPCGHRTGEEVELGVYEVYFLMPTPRANIVGFRCAKTD